MTKPPRMEQGWTIISGGQTGVDRAALDAARAIGLPYGGFVPKGRRAEDGPLPADYVGMTETKSANYAVRTRRNIGAADATLVIIRGAPDRGTLLTLRIAKAMSKPLLCLDLASAPATDAARGAAAWLAAMPPGALNIAGPRESRQPGIYAEARAFLTALLARRPDSVAAAGSRRRKARSPGGRDRPPRRSAG